MAKLLLIDGNSILNRAFYGLPDLTNSQGLHTNAVLGFFNILMKIMEEEKPEYITVAFDLKEPTFRHKMYSEYKGTRKPMPEELREQVPVMKEVLQAMGISILEKAGYEADDILGTLAVQGEQSGMEVAVLSGDRDLLQLASEHIKIRIPKTKRGTTEIEDYYSKDVEALYGVTPHEFIDMKALMGDASDNIPGVPGIGEKTAAKIIMEYHSIENAKEHVAEITPKKARESLENFYDQAVLSKELAAIKLDCELDYRQNDGKVGELFTREAFELFSRLEFKSLLQKYFSGQARENTMDQNFWLVTDISGAEDILKKAEGAQLLGLSCIVEKETLLGISIALNEEEAYWIPNAGFLTRDYLLDKWSRLLKNKKTAFMNLKENLSLCPSEYQEGQLDAGIAAYLLNPLKDTYDYEDIARDYLNLTVPSKTELLGKGPLITAMEEKPEEFMKYACYKSMIPMLSYDILTEKLKETGMLSLFLDVEMPLLYTLYHMEQEGIRVEREALREYGSRLETGIKRLEASIYDQVGEVFNINSPKQLGEILFEKLQMKGGKKTKTGYSTAADVLEKLANEYPVVSDVLEYRQLTKLKSTYADGLAAYISDDNRIHGKFNQTITATGRISSTEPNLQNIPIKMELGREIRKVFVPEEDYVFVDADYSQIELRVLAHMSGDDRLIEAYRQDRDIHRITASQVFHVPFDEVTSIQRRNAKAVNFGIVYGISSFGLSQDLSITRKEAEDYIAKYFQAYPGIRDFLNCLVETAKEKGYSITMFGRRRPVPELSSSNFMQRSFGERIAMNAPIQGTAADIIKIAMVQVDGRLRKEQMKSRLILQIHDELLIEAHKDEVLQVQKILEEEMKSAASLKVALEIDMHTGKSWFETK